MSKKKQPKMTKAFVKRPSQDLALRRSTRRCGMKKIMRTILDAFVFLLTGKGRIADEAVKAGLVDYSGQGRDRYGR